MASLFVYSAFCVFLASLAIAYLAYKHENKLADKTILNYLFGHNTKLLAAFSNVGSILSFTVIFGAIIPAIVNWGYLAVLCLVFGVLFGYLLLTLLIVKLIKTNRLPSGPSENINNTIVDIYGKDADIFGRIFNAIIYISTIMIELMFLKMIVINISGGKIWLSMFCVFAFAFVCASYVSVGGFIGVLTTDLFQMIIYCIPIIMVVFDLVESWSLQKILPIIDMKLWSKPTHLFYFGGFILTACYYFAWPDLWVRNISTLKRTNKPVIAPMWWSALGILVAVAPGVIIGLYALDALGGLKVVNADYLLNFIVMPIKNILMTSSDSTFILMVLASLVCVFVTTTDTLLIGFVQNLYNTKVISKPEHAVKLPYVVALLSSTPLIFVEFQAIIFGCGLISSMFLAANLGILLNAWLFLKEYLRKRMLCIFFLICAPLATAISIYQTYPMVFPNIGNIVLIQISVSLLIFVGLPYAWCLICIFRNRIRGGLYG